MSVSMIDPFSPLSVSWVKPLPGALIVHDHVPIKPLLKLNMLVQKSSDALLTISSPWRWGAGKSAQPRAYTLSISPNQ